MYSRLKDNFRYSLTGEGIEVGELDRGSLLKNSLLFRVGGDEFRTLVGKLVLEVAANGTALVHDEAIVILEASC